MHNFINLSIKIFTDIAEIPGETLKLFIGQKQKYQIEENYGGFTINDWKKIGNDMKRGLISFGKSK